MTLIIRAILLGCMIAALPACSNNTPDPAPLIKDTLDARRAAFTEKLLSLEDPELQKVFGQAGTAAFTMEAFSYDEPYKPEETRFSTDSFTLFDRDLSPKAFFDTYADGLILTDGGGYKSRTIWYETPFDYPFKNTLEWTSFTTEDGTLWPLPLDADNAPYSIVPAGIRSSLEVRTTTEADVAPIIQVTGTLTASVPEDFSRLTFEAADVGKWQTAGPYKIRLKTFGYHYVELDVARTDGAAPDISYEDMLIGARHTSGRYLAWQGSGQSKGGETAILHLAIDRAMDMALAGDLDAATAEADFQAIYDAVEAEYPKRLGVTFSFAGEIAAFDLAIPHDQTEQVHAFTITPLDFRSGQPVDTPIIDLPMTVTGYSWQDEQKVRNIQQGRFDLSPQQVAEEVTLTDPFIGSGFWTGLPIVGFQARYPVVNGDRMVDRRERFDVSRDSFDLTLYDSEGAEIPIVKDGANAAYAIAEGEIQIFIDSVPVRPARAKGFLTVNTAANAVATFIPAADLPDGLSIDSNQLIRERTFKLTNRRDGRELEAYGAEASGRILKSFGSHYYERSDGPALYVSYHYGQPDGIMLIERGDLVPVRYAFDVSLDAVADAWPSPAD